jgi:Bap31/Bap29 transmembrane region
MMDLGWFILSVFLVVEVIIITLLCLPMPTNDVRGVINGCVASLWMLKPVEYTVLALLALDIFYLAFVWQSLSNPLYDMGIFSHDMGVSCEYKQDLFLAERNAYIASSVLFLFFVLRRLVDIQDKLHVARKHVKKTIQQGGEESLLMDGTHNTKDGLMIQAAENKKGK